MAHTTLASTDRSLEKIGEFVSLQDYPSDPYFEARFRAIQGPLTQTNELHCIIFGALAERVAAAPGGSQLVEDLWNDFPHLMTSADEDATTMCGCFH